MSLSEVHSHGFVCLLVNMERGSECELRKEALAVERVRYASQVPWQMPHGKCHSQCEKLVVGNTHFKVIRPLLSAHSSAKQTCFFLSELSPCHHV